MINSSLKIFNKIILASIFLIGATFIDSCNEAPVEVKLTQDTLSLSSISSSNYNLVTGYNVYNVGNTGKLNNSQFIFGSAEDFNVYSFLRFYIPDFSSSTFLNSTDSSIINFDQLTADDIEFANLILSPGDYGYGDLEGNPNFEFTVHEGNTGLFLDESGITDWEDISNAGGIDTWIKPNAVIANVSAPIEKNSTPYDFEEDINYDPIIIDLKSNSSNPNLIFNWLQDIQENQSFTEAVSNYITSNEIDFTNNELYDFGDRDSIRRLVAELNGFDYDELVANFSLGLYPNSNSKFIQRFWSTDYESANEEGGTSTIELRPRIEYRFKFDPPDSIRTLEAVNFFYVNDEPEVPQNEMFVQNLISRRMILDLDLSELPEKSSVVSAQLKLTIDKERSKFGTNGFDTSNLALTYLFPLEASSNTFIEEELLKVDPLSSENRFNFFTRRGELHLSVFKEEDGDYIMQFNNLAISLDLVGKDYYKSQMMIMSLYRAEFSSEIFYSDKLVFHGLDDEDESKRPFLNVVYQRWQEE